MSEYECPKCKRVYSGAERLKSRFCLEDGMHLRPKYVRGTLSKKRVVEIEILELTREQVNVHTLYEEFMRLKDFPMGEGLTAADVPTWILDRKKAYKMFQKRFSKKEMSDLQALHDSFEDFLHFKCNMSWTTLYRSGTKALKQLKSLRRLLVFLQDESVPIQERVDQGSHVLKPSSSDS